MRKPPNPTIFIVLAGLAVPAVGGMLFMEYSSIGQIERRIETLRTETKDEKATKKELEDTQSRLAEIQGRVQHLEKSVPDYQYVPTMLKDLEEVGKKEGINVIGVRPIEAPVSNKKKDPSVPERRKPYQELTIEIKGRGQFGDALRFLEALNNFPKIVSARTVTMTPKTERGPNADKRQQVDLTVELRAYSFPEMKRKKSDTQTAQEGSQHAS